MLANLRTGRLLADSSLGQEGAGHEAGAGPAVSLPGSLLKPFLFLRVAADHPETLKRLFTCLPSSPEAGSEQACWDHRGHGILRFSQALSQSCQRGAAELAALVEPAVFLRDLDLLRFQLDHGRISTMTSEEVGAEFAGHGRSIRSDERELFAALMTTVNGGYLYRLDRQSPVLLRRVAWSPKAASAVRRGLSMAVSSGTARRAGVPGLLGKTGTVPADSGRGGTLGRVFLSADGGASPVALLLRLDRGTGSDAAELAGRIWRTCFGSPGSGSGRGDPGLRRPVRILLFSLTPLRALEIRAPAGGQGRIDGAAGSFDLDLAGSSMKLTWRGDGQLELSGGTAVSKLGSRFSTLPLRLMLSPFGLRPRVVEGRLSVTAGSKGLRVRLETTPGLAAAMAALAEHSPGAPLEALRAQIVVCNSYILASRGRHRVEGADLCDTTHCQLLSGTGVEDGAGFKTLSARLARFSELGSSTGTGYLSRDGRTVPAYFHPFCGGYLADPEDLWPGAAGPFRAGVDSRCAEESEGDWVATIEKKTLLEAVLGTTVESADLEANSYGLRVIPSGPDPHAVVTGFEAWIGGRAPRTQSLARVHRALRQSLGRWPIRGYRFRLVPSGSDGDGGDFRLQGRGRGHLAGMCQTGAARLAREGKDHHEILKHYFPGADLVPNQRPPGGLAAPVRSR